MPSADWLSVTIPRRTADMEFAIIGSLVHQAVKRTFTFGLSNMLGTP